MNVINVNFTSIRAEKKSVPKGSLNVNNNVKLTDVKDAKLGLDNARQALKVEFQFHTKYAPDVAEMELKGEIVVLGEGKETEKILKEWEKNKKLSSETTMPLLNNIMAKCSLQVIMLARELELPSPIPLPRVESKK